MAFFEKLASSLTEAGSAIHKKAKDYSANAHLDSETAALEKQIEKHFRDLGEMYYVNSTGPDTSFDASVLITEIFDAKKRLEEIRNEKSIALGKRICPQCANEIDLGSKFCQFCGVKLEPVVFGEEKKVSEDSADEDFSEAQEDDEILEEESMDAEYIPIEDASEETEEEAAPEEAAEAEEPAEEEHAAEEEEPAEEEAPAAEEEQPAEEEAPSDAPVCPFCGEVTEPDAKFCVYCGKPLS